jgi:hypothetical protein
VLIREAISSVGRTTILTMQDIMGLDSSARMNIPATQVSSYAFYFIFLLFKLQIARGDRASMPTK